MICLIIPALNEEEPIGDVVRSVPNGVVDQVVVVDNGSTDRTCERAREAGALVITEPRRGYGRACRTGVDLAQEIGAEVIAFMDGDGSDCPEFMHQIVSPILFDGYDFVIGSRTRGKREKGSLNLQQLCAGRLAGVLLRALYGVRYTDMSPFRAIRAELLKTLHMQEESYGWNLEMQMRVAARGARILEIPVDHRMRRGGESKVSGTLKGTVIAGLRILMTFFQVAADHSESMPRSI
jgi:glycosyltransferase involved in cell wall biosynthesis